MSIVLFCLVPCHKCDQIKEQITDKSIIIVNLSSNLTEWKEEQLNLVNKYNVFDDLRITAPILVLEDKTKLVGQLRIQRWLNGLR